MIVGFDTATAATAAAILLPDGRAFEARDDPGPDERPRHASRLLGLLERALAEAGGGWGDVERLAVGIGPGGFTGLRIGIATARGLAQAHGLPVVGVGSLHALGAGAAEPGGLLAGAARGGSVAAAAPEVAAVLDARRGEVFAAVWRGDALASGPAALAPEELAARLAPGAVAVGDGAVRFREVLEASGARVPPGDAREHRLSAVEVCRLGARADPVPLASLLPDYRREPDATPSR